MSTSSPLRALVGQLDDELPRLAREVIARHLDMTRAENQAFYQQPDERRHHQMIWHQWGIITHTRRFWQHFLQTVPHMLRSWGLWDAVDAVLRQPINDVSRWDLLEISILLHDIGKFAARRSGHGRYFFTGHERLSGEIIRQELPLLQEYLTPAQLAYVARTAEDHFVLGQLRRHVREQGEYDVAWVESPGFVTLAREIVERHPEDFIEIGVLFLGDSLAKANPAEGPERAVNQYEVNLAVARRYLEVVLRVHAAT